ncbi:MAG: hypothetical protein KC546_20685, partial [Anaerolineae bacterium]|nr:hypothetical protein [Anaerolineae bacterium]
PLALRRIGGRKLVVTPEGERPWAPAKPAIDGPLINALARAFRWKNLLDTGRYATVDELASAEHLNASFLARVLRLTLLAPDIVEAILNGTQGPGVTLARVLESIPLEWCEQPH